MGRELDAGSPQWAVPGVSGQQSPMPHASARLVDEAVRLTDQFAGEAASTDVGHQLVLARRLIDQLESLWLVAAADFESTGGVSDAGDASLTSWMRHRCRMAPSEASARTRVAHAITSGELVRTGEQMLDGAVTWRQAQAITNAVRQVPDDRRVEAEDAMIDASATLDPGQLRRVGDRLVHCFDRERAEAAAQRRYEQRGLSVGETIDGLVSVSGLLDPLTGSLLLTALDAKIRPPSPAPGAAADEGDVSSSAEFDPRSWPQRRADALGDICAEWLDSEKSGVVGGVRPHVSVIVDVATLNAQSSDAYRWTPAGLNESGCPSGSTESGSAKSGSASEVPEQQASAVVWPGQLSWVGPITASESQLISCDATISRILMDGPSMVLDVGRATRTIPPALRRAVIARDRTCAASGCYRPPEHCDVHHVVFWSHGGDTSLDNTVLACRRHHRLIHQAGWQVTVDRSGRRSIGPP
jgi:hypothetical protein